jgi:hypothetical protein
MVPRFRVRGAWQVSGLIASMLVGAVLVPVSLGVTAIAASTGVLNPVVTGPITASCNPRCPVPLGPVSGIHTPPEFDGQTVSSGLAARGYTEHEYFFSGTASAFGRDPSAPAWDATGNWTAKVSTTIPTAAYKSRMLVIEPSNPAMFSGTVVVEWLNVSAGLDVPVDYGYAHQELLRSGDIYVGVSAQAVGINGGAPFAGFGLKSYDPVRYGSLMHPGDNYSYDIFSQAAQAIRSPAGVNPLGSSAYVVHKMIADGESQSAGRMVTYINAIQPLAREFDGFFVHSRFSSGADLFSPGGAVPANAQIRTDQVPVMVFETETDTVPNFSARQPDGTNYRLWEAAGTAHVDGQSETFIYKYLINQIPSFASAAPGCNVALNAANERYLEDAAYSQLDTWVNVGTLPNSPPPISVVAGVIQRDAFGIAKGGIRLPEIDVPTQVTSGVGNTPVGFCSLYGRTKPLPVPLSSLYPNHAAYVAAFTAATNTQEAAGFLLAPDAAQEIANATISSPPSPPLSVSAAGGNATIRVSFSTPANDGASALLTYAASCVSSNGGTTRTQTGPASPYPGTTSLVVAGLTNGKTYRCTATAKNALGASPTSKATSALTTGAPGQPAKPAATRTTAGSLKVTFTAPPSNGAKITNYTTTCTSSNGGVTKATTGTTSPITVTGLTAGKTYTCTVNATNSRGTGPTSGPSPATTA